MSYLGTGFAPEILQNIFGYPFQSYYIQNTNEYIALNEILNGYE
jgi:hypothetical protein